MNTPTTTIVSPSLSRQSVVSSESFDDYVIDDTNDSPSSENMNSIAGEVKFSAKDPHQNGIKAFICRLMDYLTNKFGDVLKPSALNTHISAFLTDKDGWCCSDQQLESIGGSTPPPKWFEKVHAGTTYVISATCHDVPDNDVTNKKDNTAKNLAGDYAAAQALKDILEVHPKGELHISIPIAQSNPYTFGQKREHFTLLDVSVKDGKIDSATLIDSKSAMLGWIYNGAEHLTTQINTLFNKNNDHPNEEDTKNYIELKVTSTYTGEQNFINSTDCGRHTMLNAFRKAPVDNIPEVNANNTEVKATFTQFQEAYNNRKW